METLYERIGRPRLVVAPMVDQSELPWRLLSRRHGAQLCYTPMLHAALFGKEPAYRASVFTSCPEDRPLIVQFCANDAQVLANATELVAAHCDAVDINLGCPQAIARKGHYGSFLQDDWDLISDMIKRVQSLQLVPVTCKIRVFEDVQRTVAYAQMIEKAGCQLLTVHGRTREQKGSNAGLASWSHISAVKKAVGIPVFANGNILQHEDVERCMDATGVDGVMIAEANLCNPYFFEGRTPAVWQPALEYLDIVRQYPCSISSVRGHIFKLCHRSVFMDATLRQALTTARTWQDFRDAVVDLQQRYDGLECDQYGSDVPHWICQPNFHTKSIEQLIDGERVTVEALRIVKQNKKDAIKAYAAELGLSLNMAKKKLKRTSRAMSKGSNVCACGNSCTIKCDRGLCRHCCVIIQDDDGPCLVHR